MSSNSTFETDRLLRPEYFVPGRLAGDYGGPLARRRKAVVLMKQPDNINAMHW